MRIYSDDGKEFKNVAECNAYEAEQALKKQMEEAERKAKAKVKDDLLKEIGDILAKLNEKVSDYSKATNESLYFVNENGKLKARKRRETYGDLMDILFKI